MAIRSGYPDRIPIENVEVEYDKVSAPKRTVKPGFNRVRLLAIDENGLELATREGFSNGEKIAFSMHVKGVKDFVRAEGEVTKSARITVFRQPAYAVIVKLGKLTDDQNVKLTWAREQLAPKRLTPVRPAEKPDETPPAAEAPAPEAKAPEAKPKAETPPRAAAGARKTPVKRPVALLQLIDALDKFEISPDLIMAVIEAAEAGMDVEALYSAQPGDEEIEESPRPEAPPSTAMPAEGGVARPMPVYRLATNTKLHFADNNLPVGPAVELLYLSRLKSPETCFAVILETSNMTHSGQPTFRRGSILLFSTAEKVQGGDFVFVRSHGNDEFTQMFIEKGDEVRLRPLNPEFPERVLRRMEVRGMYKLVGQFVETAGAV
jgi:hypothetical protein